eukprot:TRINITY_DN1814_c0_g1_i2.p2 TRINITY_DN1814_c0_g1~~TRINITY_DN1814_c0_g1_i2.p2  ORF type:complete len:69 (-),score=26.52 TRINITY_DN1814_c0_g1_i2:244-420(-)
MGDDEYMEAYVMEQGGVFACAIEDGEGCSEKEKNTLKNGKKINRLVMLTHNCQDLKEW